MPDRCATVRCQSNFEVWELGHRQECVGHDSTLAGAIRGCRNDMGRTLTIIDSTGRVAAIMLDGRELA